MHGRYALRRFLYGFHVTDRARQLRVHGIRKPMRLRPLLPSLVVLVVAALLWAGLRGDGVAPDPTGAGQPAGFDPGPRLRGVGETATTDVAPSEQRVSHTGRVLGRDGRPAEGAILWTRGADGELAELVRAGRDGRFVLDLPAPATELWMGFGSERRVRVTLPPGESGDLGALVLRHVCFLEGVVRTADAVPAADAEVVVWSWPFGRSETRTSAGGRYRIAVPRDDEFRLSVEAGGQGRATKYGLWWAEDARLDLDLPPVVELRGRVVREEADGSRIGVPGVRVRAWTFEHAYVYGESAHGGSYAYDGVVTDDDGRFVYPGIVRWSELRVLSDAFFRPAGPYERREGEEPVIVVIPRATASGIVLDPEGKPAAGARVVGGQHCRSEPSHGTETDAQGCFTLSGLPVSAKELSLVAYGGAHRGSTKFRGEPGRSVDGLVIRLVASRHVRGRVVGPDEEPIAGVRLDVEPGDDRERDGSPAWNETGYSDARGHFVVRDVPEGMHRLIVREPGYVQREQTDVQATLAGTDVGVLVLEPHPRCRVFVTDEAGKALLDAEVQGGVVDAEGYAEPYVAPNGRFVFSVEARGWRKHRVPREDLPAEGVLHVALERSPEIRGRILDVEGNPICCAEVSTWAGERRRTFSDLAGRFTLFVPREGRCTLRVWDLFHHYPPPLEVEPGGGEVLVQAVVPTHVAGRLVDTAGRGVKGVTVYADLQGGDDGRLRSDDTDEEGRFRIDELVGSPFRVSVSGDDLRAHGLCLRDVRDVPAFTDGLLLEAQAAGTPHGPMSIHGRVVWQDGRPASDVEVDLFYDEYPPGRDDGWEDDSTWSMDDGSFRIEGLLDGRYRVRAWTCVELGNGDETEIEYESDEVVVDTNSGALRLVLRELPPEEEDEEDQQ